MIPNSAGPPEARCVICDVPMGFNDENHPNAWHSLFVASGVLEFRLGRLWRRIVGWFK